MIKDCGLQQTGTGRSNDAVNGHGLQLLITTEKSPLLKLRCLKQIAIINLYMLILKYIYIYAIHHRALRDRVSSLFTPTLDSPNNQKSFFATDNTL